MSQKKLREAMVDTQIRPADVTDYALLSAFLNVQREFFMPEDRAAFAYGEVEIPIAEARAMMTPRSLAKLLELADPKAHEEVLLVGAGYGYEAAILSKLCQSVIAIEETARLVKAAEENLIAQSVDNVVVLSGKFKAGYPKSAPYDLIVFNGAIDEVPKAYFEQLKEGGRIVAILHNDGVYAARRYVMRHGALAEQFGFNARAPQLRRFAKQNEFVF